MANTHFIVSNGKIPWECHLYSGSLVPFLQLSPEHMPTGVCFHYSLENAFLKVINDLHITKSKNNVSVLMFVYYLQNFTLLISLLAETFSSFKDTCLIFLLLFQMPLAIPFPGSLHLRWPLNIGVAKVSAPGQHTDTSNLYWKAIFFSEALSGYSYLKLQPYIP